MIELFQTTWEPLCSHAKLLLRVVFEVSAGHGSVLEEGSDAAREMDAEMDAAVAARQLRLSRATEMLMRLVTPLICKNL